MAVLLQRVVNFGTNETAAAAAQAVQDQGHVTARGTSLALEQPLLTRFGGPGDYLEIIVGAGINSNFTLPHPDGTPLPLSRGELTSVGRQLYALLERFTGYQAAVVG